MSLSDLILEKQVPLGAILSLFYTAYLVFLRKELDHEDNIDILIFFGYFEFLNLILLWPLFFLLHLSELETFDLPSREQLMYLLINGLLGTVISEALWLWGCFLTSSLMATIAISMTIPVRMLTDIVMKIINYSALFYTGTIPVLVAFISLTVLSHYENWDPIYNALRCACNGICQRTKFSRVRLNESAEQTEALIGINSEHEA